MRFGRLKESSSPFCRNVVTGIVDGQSAWQVPASAHSLILHAQIFGYNFVEAIVT